MDDPIDLVAVEEEQNVPGFRVSYSVLASIVIHSLLVVYLVTHYKPVASNDKSAPIAHYIELMKSDPRQFTEAPGKKLDVKPLNAPLSDGNRKASMPEPTGDRPRQRPGDRGTYTPAQPRGDNRPPQQADASASQQQQPSAQQQPSPQSQASSSSSSFAYHPPTQAAAASGPVDWHNAIREVSKVASLGNGQEGTELGNPGGGEKGFAESGPLSFESSWYDWGDYAESMVSRIRVNWYNIMPGLIRTGLKGVVTIRFTIQRSGRITDVQILSESGAPPYDFAAKKAIEMSSPLNALPKDFPKDSERVTCMFYYNQEPPAH